MGYENNIIKTLLIFLFITPSLISKAQIDSADIIDSASAIQIEEVSLPEKKFRHDTYIAFDSENNSYSFDLSFKENYGYLFVNEKGNVRKVDLLSNIQKVYPRAIVPNDTVLHASGSITIDKRDRIYLIYYLYYPFDSGRLKWKARIPLLLYSNNKAQSFKVYKIPGNPDIVFLEKKSPFATDNYPPLIGYTKSTNIKVSPMADINTYGFIDPRFSASGELILTRKFELTKNSPGISIHTGGESFASTFRNISSITYNEIPEQKDGNNIVVVDYDRRNARILHKKVIPLIIKSKYPYPDPHVTPVIVTLKNGEQHVMAGPQAGDFYDYTRNVSRSFNTDFKRNAVLKGPRVYASALRDSVDNIYLFFDAYKPKPGLYSQKYNQSTKSWEKEMLLAYPPKDFAAKSKDNYGIYYFKTAIDRQNNIYVSFTFFNTYEKKVFPRYMFESDDKGNKWKLKSD